MKHSYLLKPVIAIALIISIINCSDLRAQINPNATPEAKALLDLYYRISGNYTLTGQHNYPNTKDHNTRFVHSYLGQTPVIWSSDMGFAVDGNTDSYLARPDIVKEAIRQYKKGSLITLCWHAVPPTASEPVTFQPVGPVKPDSLITIQGQLTDQQFKDVLTPGTKLYNKWCAQVDSIAVYLKKLQEANVPVLWRPYHEMNGNWFWWGGRVGQNSTADLYRQIYDRMVNFHKLNNLVWVWNVDRPTLPIRKFSNFYPGDKYFDIASLDVYGSDFNQAYYDSLLVLAHGKPILLGEVGNPPSVEVLKKQPKWASWVIWSGFVKSTSKKQLLEMVNNPGILSLEDPAYWKVINPYRNSCGLPLLPLKAKYPITYTGTWVLSEDKSNFGNSGSSDVPVEIEIDQDNDYLFIKKLHFSEWGDHKYSNEDIVLDGSEMKSKINNSPIISKAIWDAKTKSIQIFLLTKFKIDGQDKALESSEEWTLLDGGKTLKIVHVSPGYGGEQISVTLMYSKRQ